MNPWYLTAPIEVEASGFDVPSRMGQVIGQHVYKPVVIDRPRRKSGPQVGNLALSKECRQIATALKNPNWDFRTIDGIARETGLSRAAVEHWIDQDGISRRPVGRPDAELFTVKERPVSWRERLSLWSSFVAKQSR